MSKPTNSLRHWLFAIFALMVVIYVGLLARVFFTQRSFLYFPPPPSEAFTMKVPRPDLTLGGWVIEGKGDLAKDALVVFGGNAMSLSPWGRGFLRACTDRTLVLVPYRSYEGNPGEIDEETLIQDGAAVVEWAAKRYERVGVFGVSLGSGVATAVAADAGKKIDVLALGTPYDRLDLVGRDHMPWVFPQLLMHDTFDSASRIKRVQVPIHALRATEDQIIYPPRTKALQQAATRGEWIALPGTHDGVWGSDQACQWLVKATR